MPQPYPTPSGFNSTVAMVNYTNTVTHGYMTPLALFAIWIIAIIIGFKTNMRFSDNLFVSSFITFILGSLLWAAGLVAGKIIVIFLLLTVASGIYSVFDN